MQLVSHGDSDDDSYVDEDEDEEDFEDEYEDEEDFEGGARLLDCSLSQRSQLGRWLRPAQAFRACLFAAAQSPGDSPCRRDRL